MTGSTRASPTTNHWAPGYNKVDREIEERWMDAAPAWQTVIGHNVYQSHTMELPMYIVDCHKWNPVEQSPTIRNAVQLALNSCIDVCLQSTLFELLLWRGDFLT